MSTPNDLQALLASIRPRPSPSGTPGQDSPQSQYPQQPQYLHSQQHQQQQHGGFGSQPHDGQSLPHPHQQHGYHHPSVLSALQSPSPPANTPPHQSSDILSPNVPTPQPQQQAGSDRAVNLLNLLRFSQGPSPAQQQSPAIGLPQTFRQQSQETLSTQPPKAERSVSTSDLMAAFFGGQGPASAPAPAATAAGPAAGAAVRRGEPAASAETVPADDTQEMLLRLLNRSKPSLPATDRPDNAPTNVVAAAVPAEADKLPSPSDTGAGQTSTVVEPQVAVAPKPTSAAPKESMFTYVNPFDQLAAASPRKRTPQPKPRGETPVAERQGPAPSATAGTTVEQQKPTSIAVVEPNTQAARDAEDVVRETVAEALQASVAAAEAELTENLAALPSAETEVADSQTPVETQKTAEMATEVPATVTTTVHIETSASQDAADALVDSWESAEDSAEKDEERVVAVHNFPLKPFISITVRPWEGKLASLRDDGIMDIARLRKDFDQLDRSLTSATAEYIVYALAKNGGMRIIRQDDGSDKQVFRSTRDRIFHVTLCTSPTTMGTSKEQAVLGIGVSGAVYWAMISRPEKDLFEMDALESESLIFAPFPASDENTSGGQLKTRAKRSSRHPEFFAIGRGKNIYVVSPKAAMSSDYGVSGSQRLVDTEKFFKERALKISTGKAGKDFVFSDDDTVIASLDKTGRLRFWDVREVVNNSSFVSADGPVPTDIRVPLNTFVTGSPTEKSWPTSVLFLDKLRPYAKSMALRYILVGLKQNHTLQLWDIGLGKAVQELKFPHENESDAICSVAYHPASGIIVVGHPTRNSIYFVHLSAPRYNLQPMSQASFVKRAAEKDGSLPKPESTACLSGIREISFASKGQLRSLDILPINKAPGGDKRGPEDESALFELYVMHSRGVTCLNIKKEDLGWSADNKILRPVNALDEGFIEIADLQTFPSYIADELSSVNGDAAPTPQKAVVKETVKITPEVEATAGAAPSRTQSPTKLAAKQKAVEEPAEKPANGTEKVEKKKKKKGAAAAGDSVVKVKEIPSAGPAAAAAFTDELPAESRTSTTTSKKVKESITEQSNGNNMSATEVASVESQPPAFVADASMPAAVSTATWNKQLEELQTSVAVGFSKSLGREFEALYGRFDEERRAWDAASAAKQDQVLRLVSSTLSDNVEKNLARIVSQSIKADVLPALTTATSSAVSQQLSELISQQLGGAVPRELRNILPDAVHRAVQQSDMMKNVSDMMAQKLASHIESDFSRTMHSTITPAFKNVALRAAEKIGSDVERQVQVQMKHYEVQRHNDSAKIDQLTNLVRGLSETVNAMAATQTGLQNEVVRLNRLLSARQAEETRRTSQPPALPAAAPEPVPTRSPEEMELAEIAQLMRDGRYEEGSVKWLQSSQQADLFDNLFVRLNPTYLTGLSPIVALSVGVAVTTSLQTNVAERLAWLEVVLQTVNLMDPDIREVAPKIMDILTQRLESLYMSIAEHNPHDPILRKIPPLSRRARELRGPQ